MLAQHQISDRVFCALFGDPYTKAGRTPAARALQAATEALNGTGLGNETEVLEDLYRQIEARVEYIETDDARQHLLRDLYDTFFRHAFVEGKAGAAADDGEITAADRGIAYTPLELVDWLLEEADRTLREIAPKGSAERRLGLAAPKVSVVDGFSGTGTFIARLIGTTDQDKPYWLSDDVVRRKRIANEFHANEIELLPHMIGVANIENEYRYRTGDPASFSGGVLTDTFEETSRRDLLSQLEDDPANRGAVENHERRYAQQTDIIEVFIGNPPWNVFQVRGGDRTNIKDRVTDTSPFKVLIDTHEPLAKSVFGRISSRGGGARDGQRAGPQRWQDWSDRHRRRGAERRGSWRLPAGYQGQRARRDAAHFSHDPFQFTVVLDPLPVQAEFVFGELQADGLATGLARPVVVGTVTGVRVAVAAAGGPPAHYPTGLHAALADEPERLQFRLQRVVLLLVAVHRGVVAA